MKRVAFLLLAVSVVVAVYSCGDGDPGVVLPANRTPVAVGAIPARELAIFDTVTVDLSGYFNDPDGDRLVYAASTSDPAAVSAAVAANFLSLVAGADRGSATVTVTARDPGGLSATQTLDVTVVGKPGFLQVVLNYPEPDIGAVVLFVQGPSVDSVRAGSALTAYQAPAPDGVHVFVAGPIPESGTVLRFWTDDVTEVGDYAALVEQAAGKTYEQRPVESATALVAR